jgi:hypothetical protein
MSRNSAAGSDRQDLAALRRLLEEGLQQMPDAASVRPRQSRGIEMPFTISMRAAMAMFIFIVVSILFGAAMCSAGGWRSMAIWYPARAIPPRDEERFRFVTLRTSGGMIGMATYSSCVNVGIGPLGISLALWAPFRLYHPPLFIPWDAVERCRLIEMPGGELVQFAVKHGTTVMVRGAAGAAILREAAQRGLVETAPAPW